MCCCWRFRFCCFSFMWGRSSPKEDTKKDQPKELSTSFGETRDSIMTKNDAYDAFSKNGDNRSMLEGLDKGHDSLMSYQDQISIDQKRRIDSLKAVSSRQNQIGKRKTVLLQSQE